MEPEVRTPSLYNVKCFPFIFNSTLSNTKTRQMKTIFTPLFEFLHIKPHIKWRKMLACALLYIGFGIGCDAKGFYYQTRWGGKVSWHLVIPFVVLFLYIPINLRSQKVKNCIVFFVGLLVFYKELSDGEKFKFN